MLNLLNPNVRKQIIEETKGDENKQRKNVSFSQNEIFKDRIYESVKAYLEGFYSKQTIQNTPIVSSVNLARRIIKKEASLYTKEPERKYYNMSDEQIAVVQQVYEDMKIDSVMQKLNENFKLQDQAHLYIIPRKGKLKAMALLSHQLDVVPSSEDSEDPEVFILNGFDRTLLNVPVSSTGDNLNAMIADEDDYKASLKRSAVWSPMFNFIIDEDGNIVSPPDQVENPLNGVVPFVDVFNSKDGEYWVRTGSALTDFTIQFCAGLTDVLAVSRMQGFGQAYLKAPMNLIPQEIQIGTHFVLRLPVDPNNPVDTEFGYANANPDLAGSLAVLESLLSAFLTSRGVDPKTVNTKNDSEKFSSGIDRLLSQIEQFTATEQDMCVFEDAEMKAFKIVVAYINTYGGSSVLPEYKCAPISPDAYIDVEYQKPQSVMSESEKLSNIQTRLEMGLITKVDAIAIDQNLDEEQAIAKFEQINLETGGGVSSNLNGAQMKSIADVVANVSLGLIPRESAVKLVALAFGIEEDKAGELIATAGAGFIPTEGAKPVQ
jgi:hypothetical protein